MTYTDRWGKPLMTCEQPFQQHWTNVSLQIQDGATKFFIVGFVYTVKDGEYSRQTQGSPYRPARGTATRFDTLDALLNDLDQKIKPKRAKRTKIK